MPTAEIEPCAIEHPADRFLCQAGHWCRHGYCMEQILAADSSDMAIETAVTDLAFQRHPPLCALGVKMSGRCDVDLENNGRIPRDVRVRDQKLELAVCDLKRERGGGFTPAARRVAAMSNNLEEAGLLTVESCSGQGSRDRLGLRNRSELTCRESYGEHQSDGNGHRKRSVPHSRSPLSSA